MRFGHDPGEDHLAERVQASKPWLHASSHRSNHRLRQGWIGRGVVSRCRGLLLTCEIKPALDSCLPASLHHIECELGLLMGHRQELADMAHVLSQHPKHLLHVTTSLGDECGDE